MNADVVVVHPLPSVTVTVYEPPLREEAVVPVPPEGDQLYVYPPLPPLALTVADPLLPPLQVTLLMEDIVATIAAGCVIVAVVLAVQLCASVTVTV